MAAIVHADVAFYARHVGRDEAMAAVRLRDRREVLARAAERRGGTVADMAGDSALIRFDSAHDAVRFAVDAQGEVARLNDGLSQGEAMFFRMGIATGDVLDDGPGIIGDPVNIAARLGALAEPGGFCVSRQVYEVVAGRLELRFTSLGSRNLKNLPLPVRAYATRGAGRLARFTAAGGGGIRLALFVAVLVGLAGLAAAGLGWWKAEKLPSVVAEPAPPSPPFAAAPSAGGIVLNAPPFAAPAPRLFRSAGPFQPERITFLSQGKNAALLAAYRAAPVARALVADASDAVHIASGRGTPDAAVSAALDACRAAGGVNCLLIAVNDDLATWLPRTFAVSGIWDHLSDPDLPAGMRPAVTVALAQGLASFAVAKGAGGAIGVAASRGEEEAAMALALQTCARNGPGCQPFALGPFRVTQR